MLPAEITHRASKGLQAAAIFAALCTMAMADDGTPATCPIPSHIPVWGTTYKGQVLCFVGTDPRNGPGATYLTTPVVPVKLRYLDVNGAVDLISDPTAPLPPPTTKLSAMDAVLDSPIFKAQDFTFGGTSVGNVQWIEAAERASFWKYPGAKFDNWHITMVPYRFAALTLDVPKTDWKTDPDSLQVRIVTNVSRIDDFITSQLQSGGYDGFVPIFLFYNVKEPGVGGYHRINPSSDGFFSPYIFASYDDPGNKSTDIHALSHEVAEFAHDPFASNSTPWPQHFNLPWNPPYVFTAADCGNILEVGDPTETRSPSGKDITIGNSTMTYNFDNIALASWFMQASPSFSVNGWYTLNGPIDGEFGAPAPACPSVSGAPKVTGISPASGPTVGGTTVTVTGEALSLTDKFHFGDFPATGVSCPGANTCTVVTPEQGPGPVDLIVKSPAGDSQGVVFTYLVPVINKISPASGPLEGGTTVTVTGETLSTKLEFDFDGYPATKVDCPDRHTCTMATPKHKPGTVEVIIKQATGNALTYSYLGLTIKSFNPVVGPTSGGLTVAISGDSLSDDMTVNFGAYSATHIHCGGSSTDCIVTSPAVPSNISLVGGMDTSVPLTITVDGITSAPSKNLFTFAVFPTLTLMTPSSGTTGSPINITGTDFSTVAGKTTFTFSGIPATGVTCAKPTTCSLVVPGMVAQTVNVLVTVDGHTSLNGGVFTNTAKLPPPPPM